MDFVNLRHSIGRCAQIADTKPRHRVGFRETVQHNRAFLHAGKRREAGVRPFVGEIAINFIGNDDEIMFLDKFGNLRQLVFRHHRARRIVRITDQKHFRLRRDFFFQRRDRQFEIIFFIRRDEDRRAARKLHAGRIRHIRGVRNEHLIARIQKRGHRNRNRFGHADGRDDFRIRIVLDAVALGKQFRHQAAQLDEPHIRRVRCLLFFQTLDASVDDFIRRRIIRLADAQRNDAFHRIRQIKKFTNPGRRDHRDIF